MEAPPEDDDFNDGAWDDDEGPIEDSADRAAGAMIPTTNGMLTAKERIKQAVQMRQAGVAFSDIAEALGYSTEKTAQQAVARALSRSIREAADEHVELQLQRYEQLMMVHWNKAMAGDAASWDRVVKAMDKIDAYYGVGAAQQKLAAAGNITVNMNGAEGEQQGVLVIQGDREARIAGLKAMAADAGLREIEERAAGEDDFIDVDGEEMTVSKGPQAPLNQERAS